MEPDAVVEQVRAGGLLAAGAPVVVLLSGGRDSVCLLDVAARVAGAGAVTALHVDYGLRAEAAEDARHCAALCDELGVELVLERAGEPAGNVQGWARELRYAAAERLARARDAAIAAGHTADDQVETILYRLAAAPSRRALLGMRPREGRLVRPLLTLTRAATTAYCEARGLAWRDDVTNAGGRYARNRVRHGLAAALREIHPAAEANVLRLAELLRDEAEVLDALVEEQLDPAPPTSAPAPAAGRSIALDRLAALPPALRRLVVQRLADDAAGRPVGGAVRRADAVAALRRTGTALLDLGGGVRAVAEYGTVRAELAPRGPRGEALHGAAGAQAPPAPVALPLPGRARFGAWEVVCEEASAPAPVGGPLVGAAAAAADGARAGAAQSPSAALLDRAALDAAGGALTIRAWRAGDRIVPAGRSGAVTLQDLFTAQRIPRARRALLPLVVRGEQVVWVPGIATAARFAATAATGAAVRLTASEA